MRLHTDDSFSKQISLSVLTLLQKEDDKECWLNNQSDHLCKHKLLIGPRQIYTHTLLFCVYPSSKRCWKWWLSKDCTSQTHTHPCRFQSVSSIIQKAVCYKSLLLHVNSWQCHKNEVQKLSSVVLFSHILHSRKKACVRYSIWVRRAGTCLGRPVSWAQNRHRLGFSELAG